MIPIFNYPGAVRCFRIICERIQILSQKNKSEFLTYTHTHPFGSFEILISYAIIHYKILGTIFERLKSPALFLYSQ